MEQVSFRYAEEKDVFLILQFIRELAEYENMSDEVVTTEDLLREWIFVKKKAEVIFVTEEEYVKPEYRGKGYGKTLLKKLAQIALERGCGRLEWVCLDWHMDSIWRRKDSGKRNRISFY